VNPCRECNKIPLGQGSRKENLSATKRVELKTCTTQGTRKIQIQTSSEGKKLVISLIKRTDNPVKCTSKGSNAYKAVTHDLNKGQVVTKNYVTYTQA